jgi:hypothetical protein
MPHRALAMPHPARTIAFELEELLLIRSWAAARGLHMEVALDRVLGGQPCEEVLLLVPRPGGRPLLTFWRLHGEVMMQAAGGPPRRHAGVAEALRAPIRTRRRRSFWG